MGLLDFFRRRSEKESALPGADQVGTFSVGSAPAQGADQEGSATTVVTDSLQTIDASNVMGLRDSMFDVLRRHGIDPEGRQSAAIDASSVPGLAEEIQRTLSSHGIQIPGAAWTPQGTAGIMQMSEPPAGTDTDDRLSQLTQLRDSGLITAAEFEQQRSRILGEL